MWFKFELYNEIDQEHPAISLAIDNDNNQATGLIWWSKDSTFKYDIVLNIGISEKICGTKVRGYNGITSAPEAINNNWLNEKRNNLIFYSSSMERAYYLGVKRAEIISTGNRLNIVGSVGANSAWNDDIGEDFVKIEIPIE